MTTRDDEMKRKLEWMRRDPDGYLADARRRVKAKRREERLDVSTGALYTGIWLVGIVLAFWGAMKGDADLVHNGLIEMFAGMTLLRLWGMERRMKGEG